MTDEKKPTTPAKRNRFVWEPGDVTVEPPHDKPEKSRFVWEPGDLTLVEPAPEAKDETLSTEQPLVLTAAGPPNEARDKRGEWTAGGAAASHTKVRLTKRQADEVQHGLEIDRTDGNPDWGTVSHSGKTVHELTIAHLDHALYRITSARDIFRDNAAEDPSQGPPARSMTNLIETILKAAPPSQLATLSRASRYFTSAERKIVMDRTQGL